MTEPGTDNAATDAATDTPIVGAPTAETPNADAPNADAPKETSDDATAANSVLPTLSENNYDFRQPSRLAATAAKQVSDWQQRITSLLPEKLSCHVSELRCTTLECEVGTPDKVEPPHPLLAFRCQINDEHETILAIHRPLAVTLVNAMLGEIPESMCEDRELTLVEQSLLELVIRDIIELLDESGQPMGIRVSLLGGERRTQFIRLFPPGESIALLNFQLEGSFGAGNICWTWPQAILEDVAETDEPHVPAPQLAELAQRFPFEVIVHLGKAHLTVQQLLELKVGDIVVLDQPVGEPLAGEVGGREKLHVWPGREGHRQAVQIDAIVDA